MNTRPRAAAPVKAFAAVESAPPVLDAVEVEVAVEEVVGVVAVAPLPEAVAVGVDVSVTPTLLQMPCEYASADARSAASQEFSMH